MAGFSEEDIRKVREANDVVSVIGDRVPVRQRGRDFWCCCPIHDEKTPSCKIDPAAQLWHCFGCGAGGDVFSFVMQVDDLDFPDAVRKLAERGNVQITESGKPAVAHGYKARLKEICKETAAFYHTQLMRGKEAGAASARSYLAGRGLGGEVPKRWELGYAPGGGQLVRHLKAKGFKDKELVDANVALDGSSDGRRGGLKDRFYNRIMFPIYDVQGECIAFGGRIIGDGQPKYLNSQETPVFHKSEVLFGLDKAKAAMASSGVAVVVEGYTDVIALSEAGIKNAVATLGTALTHQHIRALSRHAKQRIIYLFDGDEAGQRAADRALGFIDKSMTPEAGRTKIELAAVTLPDNLDPADFVEQRGAAALSELLASARPLLKYGIERRIAKHDLSSAEGRATALADALSVLAPIKDSILAKDYAIQIAGMVRARENDVLDQLAALEAPRAQGDRDEAEAQPHLRRAPQTSGLSQSELSRRRYEREFLSLIVRHPEEGLRFADALAQTQWHEQVHGLLAHSILDTLAANPDAKGPELVTRAQATIPAAANILTAGSMTEDSGAQALASFLAEELALGDMEDAMAALKAQLSRAEGLEAQEYEMLFESAVAMQKELARRRQAHRSVG
ncbi:DNA primase [Raoultibacter phocaeensis]|uniref:DNA primase n=1 Tax=Raoultibacter phocaeensis TaxID=2479841 RepID=UPI0011193C62|nr:DNA primase [Raoultibacter phocaeensis]